MAVPASNPASSFRILRVFRILPSATEAQRAPAIVETTELPCLTSLGILGDRNQGPEASVLLFSGEVLSALRREFSRLDLPDWAPRRNILTSGANLAEWVGREFLLQGVHLRGLSMLEPEPWFEQEVGRGACAWLRGQAGLRARVLSDGLLKPDPVDGTRERTSGSRLAEVWPDHEWE